MNEQELNFLKALKQLCIEHKIYIDGSDSNGFYLDKLESDDNLAIGVFFGQYHMCAEGGKHLNRPEMLI